MMEGASHGIAAVDCFELFGFPEDAPNLRDANSPGGSLRPGVPIDLIGIQPGPFWGFPSLCRFHLPGCMDVMDVVRTVWCRRPLWLPWLLQTAGIWAESATSPVTPQLSCLAHLARAQVIAVRHSTPAQSHRSLAVAAQTAGRRSGRGARRRPPAC